MFDINYNYYYLCHHLTKPPLLLLVLNAKNDFPHRINGALTIRNTFIHFISSKSSIRHWRRRRKVKLKRGERLVQGEEEIQPQREERRRKGSRSWRLTRHAGSDVSWLTWQAWPWSRAECLLPPPPCHPSSPPPHPSLSSFSLSLLSPSLPLGQDSWVIVLAFVFICVCLCFATLLIYYLVV